MIGTTGAVLGATAIGGISSLLSGLIGSDAATSAASVQDKAALANIALQKEGLGYTKDALDYTKATTERSRNDSLPWLEAGRNALDQVMVEMGLPRLSSARAQPGAVGPAVTTPGANPGTTPPGTATPGTTPAGTGQFPPPENMQKYTDQGLGFNQSSGNFYFLKDGPAPAGTNYNWHYENGVAVYDDPNFQSASQGAAPSTPTVNGYYAPGAVAGEASKTTHNVNTPPPGPKDNPYLPPPPAVKPAVKPLPTTAIPATPVAAETGSGFRKTPGYDFQVQEGEKGVLNNLAALGLKGSGAALKALTRFRTGLADQTYGDYLTRLTNLATGGQNQVNNTNANALSGANSVSNGSNSVANSLGGIGQATVDAGAIRGSSFTGPANQWINALQGVGTSTGNALGWLSRGAAGARA